MIPKHPGAIVIALPPMEHLAFIHEGPDGTTRAWDITRGNAVGADGRPLKKFSLADHGVTLDFIRQNYVEIDLDYARTTDLSRPLLVIPLGEEILILDGWHRLARAVMEGIEELPICMLTQAEADSIQWLELPAGHGIDWK